MTTITPIEDQQALEAVLAELHDESSIGVDTEFMREKTYYPSLCLIQVQAPATRFCIDTIQVANLDALRPLLESRDLTWIFHSCRQDMEVLELALGAMPSRIYDTQLAASFCGYGEQVSYSSLVETICNVKLEKDQTRTDWTRRPLSQDQLRYAMDDVRYLPEIRESLDQKLLALGRKEWFDNESDLLGDTVSVQVDPRDAWKRLKGGGRLPAKEQHLARDLAEWRERKAQKRDRPREWILSSRAILDICNARPRDLGDLARIESLNDGIVRHSGREILGILKDGVSSDDQSLVWTKGRMLDRTERDRVRQIMNRIREMAEDAAISPSLLANRNDVEQYVSGDSTIPLLSGWRYDFVGRQLVAEFAQV